MRRPGEEQRRIKRSRSGPFRMAGEVSGAVLRQRCHHGLHSSGAAHQPSGVTTGSSNSLADCLHLPASERQCVVLTAGIGDCDYRGQFSAWTRDNA